MYNPKLSEFSETARWRNRPRMFVNCAYAIPMVRLEVIATDKVGIRDRSIPITTSTAVTNTMPRWKNGWNAEGPDDSVGICNKLAEAPALLLAAQQMPGIRLWKNCSLSRMKKFSDKLYVFSFEKNFAGLSRD